MKTIIHKECGGIAYYCDDRKYDANERISHAWLYHKDKSNCVAFEVMRCGTCGKEIHFELSNGDIEAHDGHRI